MVGRRATDGEISHYGIVEQERDQTAAARLAGRIRLVGYGVLPSGLSAGAVAELGERLDHVMARQVEEFGGPERMAAIGDTLTARCPLVYDDAFTALAAHPALLALARELLGNYVVLMQQNGVINPPKQAPRPSFPARIAWKRFRRPRWPRSSTRQSPPNPVRSSCSTRCCSTGPAPTSRIGPGGQ
jgi:hypothetical protein